MSRFSTILLLVLSTLISMGCGSPPALGLLGAYRFEDGRYISIRRSVDETLRYREYATGKSGRLYRDSEGRFVSGAGFSQREPVEIVVEFETGEGEVAQTLLWTRGGAPSTAHRIGVDEWVEFESDGERLSGRLHLPEGPGPHPAIVLVHGSGKSPGSEWFYNGDFFAAHGIAVLAFDKRGSGRSQGDFSFDFHQLARDVIAGVDLLREHASIDGARIGLAGYSQGAWVAPLAASMSEHVRFVLVSYGMVESPAEEARLEMRQLVVDGGVEADELAAAEELIAAAVEIVATDFRDGWDHFHAMKKNHGDAPWRKHLDGTPVAQLMKYPKWLIKILGPRKAPKGLDWNYDSTELLQELDIPVAWFLGSEDSSAPNQQTIAKLRAWEAEGRPVELTVFPGAEHTMILFEEREDGRVYTSYAPDYFRAEVDTALRFTGLASR